VAVTHLRWSHPALHCGHPLHKAQETLGVSTPVAHFHISLEENSCAEMTTRPTNKTMTMAQFSPQKKVHCQPDLVMPSGLLM
jgi:hypothetical protein